MSYSIPTPIWGRVAALRALPLTVLCAVALLGCEGGAEGLGCADGEPCEDAGVGAGQDGGGAGLEGGPGCSGDACGADGGDGGGGEDGGVAAGDAHAGDADAGCSGDDCTLTCSQHDDCPDGLCRGHTCVERECTRDEDCLGGMCETGVCSAPECVQGDDCSSGVCEAYHCAAPTCADGVQNGSESDIDCGGGCAACPTDARCSSASDCASLSCGDAHLCLEATCDDGIVNGSETGSDCGGDLCHACGERPVGGPCLEASECASDVCTDGSCAAPSCEDDVANGDETDQDCGGAICEACADELGCAVDEDCDSQVCSEGTCAEPSCEDDAVNGSETALGCGGQDCEPCGVGDACLDPSDCSTGVCGGGQCVAATCEDDVVNGFETDEDCGGEECAPCEDLSACQQASDCLSGVCSDGVCAEPSCEDDVVNGDETDEDCGGAGECDRCERGAACDLDSDCDTGACRGDACVLGPEAGFSVAPESGYAPLYVTASGSASAGDGAIVSVEYDWGDGFTGDAGHRFDSAGSFVVTQRVTDSFGLVATTTQPVVVDPWTPVCLSDTDRTENVVLTDGCRVVEMRNTTMGNGGSRTTQGVSSGSGVYYFEGQRLGRIGSWGFGLTVEEEDLSADWGGQKSLIYTSAGGVATDSFTFVGASPVVGLVLDYRASNPEVFVILDQGGGSTVVHSAVLTEVTEPMFAMFQGMIASHGPMAKLNFGDDLENHPFQLDPGAALLAANEEDVASALVLGFAQSRSLPPTTTPSLTTSADMSVPAGTEVTLTASASDVEDGDLTAAITWENQAVSYYERERGTGGSFTFTPEEVGLYPISVEVKDALGVSRKVTVTVTATGALTQYPTPQLIERGNTGDLVTLSPDGLSVHFGGGGKQGVLANQGIYGDFWYFEVERHNDPVENTGSGLTVLRGSLNPFSFETTQPSAQVNFIGGFWHDLIFQSHVDTSSGVIGYAVDYRTEHPTVHVITDDTVAASAELENVWLPLYPTVYGNLTVSSEPWDSTINFGASPFQNDPTTALQNAGVDTSEFEAGWGADVP